MFFLKIFGKGKDVDDMKMLRWMSYECRVSPPSLRKVRVYRDVQIMLLLYVGYL